MNKPNSDWLQQIITKKICRFIWGPDRTYLGTKPVEVVHYFTVKQPGVFIYLYIKSEDRLNNIKFIYLFVYFQVIRGSSPYQAIGAGTANDFKILGQMSAERLVLLAFSS